MYPVARGSGPLLTAAVAIAAFGERLTVATVVGAVGVTAGTVLVSGAHRRWVRRPEDSVQTPTDRDENLRVRRGVLYGLGTGLAIAGYSVVDGYAVKHLTMTPILVVFLCDACRTVLFLPMALPGGAATRALCMMTGVLVLAFG